MMHCVSRCKRDALPTELSARIAEEAAFTAVSGTVKLGFQGTERKRAEASGHRSPGVFPKCAAVAA